MRPNIKIATCCYCGSRSMLKPTARHGHELACASCGAPLHEMKWLKAPAQPVKARPTKTFHSARKRKPRKAFWRRALEEVWDEVEDIFD
ncbi:hypothetical protein [uncultured Litoreibacter sp.]|uniref:hypothetical protein n=1 Tax=uncultured Litoreibacter sp. TaxID=1392394 RepID=UPI002636933D|nr:hypothetical protein [uncultured Litoreibacter sp.]